MAADRRHEGRRGDREPHALEAIERAQRKVEAHNFDARKNLLEYDDVANDQRKVIYQQRTELMAAEDVGDSVAGIRHEVVNTIDRSLRAAEEPGRDVGRRGPRAGDRARLHRARSPQGVAGETTRISPRTACVSACRRGRARVPAEGGHLRRTCDAALEKQIMLHQLDSHWREHLAAMDYLRQGIHLRSYAQKNPKQEYKREAFELFTTMLDRIKHDTVSMLWRVQLRTEAEIQAEEAERQRRLARAMQFQHAAPEQLTAPPPAGPLADPEAPRRRARRAVRARDEESRPQRAVSVRLGQEVQALPRRVGPRRLTRETVDRRAVGESKRASAASRTYRHVSNLQPTAHSPQPSSSRTSSRARCRRARPRADRAASGRQAHGRRLGIPGRQARAR